MKASWVGLGLVEAMRHAKILDIPEGRSDGNWSLHMVIQVRMIFPNFSLWLADIIDQEVQEQRLVSVPTRGQC